MTQNLPWLQMLAVAFGSAAGGVSRWALQLWLNERWSGFPLGTLLVNCLGGLLIGMAQAGTTYAVVYGVIARNVAANRRSWAMGVTAAAGSFGQFLMVPVETWLISAWGWQNALFVLGCLALAIIPLAAGLKEPAMAAATGFQQSVRSAVREAFGHRSFQWLMAG